MHGELKHFHADRLNLLIRMPRSTRQNSKVLIVVHGIARERKKIFDAFVENAPSDLAIIAPMFDDVRFPHYQKLGVQHLERRADFELDSALDDLSARMGLDTKQFDLFGFSGGAQFAHRYAMLNPRRVRSLHVSSSGYYTFLDDAPWPRGLRRWSDHKRVIAGHRFFLRQQINVYVGENDLDRDENFRTNERIDEQQGRNRVQRAAAWAHHIGELQRELNLPQAALTLLPDTAHSFEDATCSQKGDLVRRVLGASGAIEMSRQRPSLSETLS